MTSDATPGWAQARRLLEDALRRPDGPAELRVGHVRRVGSGRSHDVYCARVIVAPDDGRSGVYAVLLPSRDADRDARRYAGRERALLEHIAAATDRIRVPHITAVVPTRDGNAVVRPWLGGEPLDLREGRQPPLLPWEVVGEIAATIHGVDLPAGLELSGYPTRRAHARACLAAFDGLVDLAEARAWATAHLPPDEPASLVHGDLLGQNILVDVVDGAVPAVIDWEFAHRGDPAYDLAIVTRGARRPFDREGGFDLFLDAYNRRAPRAVAAHEVRFHEMCIAAGWYRDGLAEASPDSMREARHRVEIVLGRAGR